MKGASASFLALTLLTMLGCAATPTTENTGQFIDDTAITAKVKAAILDQPTLKLLDIHIATNKGIVDLWGVVGSRSMINKVVAVARPVPGVKSVRNHMRLM